MNEYLGIVNQGLDNNTKKETMVPILIGILIAILIACYCLLNNLPPWQARIEL